MRHSNAEIIREYGPFAAAEGVRIRTKGKTGMAQNET